MIVSIEAIKAEAAALCAQGRSTDDIVARMAAKYELDAAELRALLSNEEREGSPA